MELVDIFHSKIDETAEKSTLFLIEVFLELVHSGTAALKFILFFGSIVLFILRSLTC